MTNWMNSWNSFLNESKEPVIKEVTEEQVELVSAVMQLPPEELPFNDIFKGTMRTMQPIKVVDPTLLGLMEW